MLRITRKTSFDKILRGKAFNITKNCKYTGYQRGVASMLYKFFDKKTSSGATTLANKPPIKNEIFSNKE